jgi:small subunit ribosomal protein S13
MARIAGVNIPLNKHIRIALTYIYGVGPTTAESILKQAEVKGDIKTKDLTEDQVKVVRDLVEKGRRLEGDLKRDVLSNVKRLKEIASYRGSRHSKHLPVHGQRTKTNSRTVRGNVRKTTGSGRRALTKT